MFLFCGDISRMVKTVEAPEPSDVSLVLIASSGGAGNQVMVELCHGVLHGYLMSAD